MQRITKWAFVVIVFLFSCNSGTIIPKKDMVSILAKIYITDATVLSSDFRKTYYDKDTIEYYGKTIQSFGYTPAQFDSSLKFYSKEPKVLDAIYDKVIIELSMLETDLTVERDLLSKKDSSLVDTSANLWNIKTIWHIPEDGIDNHIYFKIPVIGLGTYTFSANFQVFDDDKSVKPRMSAYFYYDDLTPTGKLSQIEHRNLLQDGVMRNIQVQLELKDQIVTHFTGYLLDNGNDNGKVNKHALISDIKVTYKPFPSKIKKPLRKVKLSESAIE